VNKKLIKIEKKWFEQWFDSPYYHLLYKNRDEVEAEKFIKNLIAFLQPPSGSIMLDVACGKGRHSIYLNKLGYNVDGFDLAENSIIVAKKQEAKNLKFYVNDIRKPLKINHYNYAFNLFTSFGYFEDETDNLLAIYAISESLKTDGILVLDFMNVTKVVNNLQEKETKIINDNTFLIKRSFFNNFIIKDIDINDKGITHHFQEKVKAITLADFRTYFNAANLKIEAIFGNYNLTSFDEKISDRLIVIAKKQ